MKSGALSLGILSFASLLTSALVVSNPDYPINITADQPSSKAFADCDCFTVSGPDPGYYQHYKLWDFRAVPLERQINPTFPEPNNDLEDDWIDSQDDSEDGEYFEDDVEEYSLDGGNHSTPNAMWFFETAFDKDWVSQQWHRPGNSQAPVDMVNSKRNVFFTRDSQVEGPYATYLVLRTTRHKDFTSTAEIETRVRNIYRCSFRVRLRILPASVSVPSPSNETNDNPLRQPWQHAIPALNSVLGNGTNTTGLAGDRPHPGACIGIFTYHARNCESDIEILTSDPSDRVRYANQPDYDPVTDKMIPGASTVANLPVAWTGWSTHRLDWLAEVSRWWVDDTIQDAKTYRVPNLQSRLVINLWSDGGVWTGDMALGDSIFLGIEYIELAYNRSSDGSRGAGIPPSLRHGGHQRPNDEVSFTNIEEIQELWEPDTDMVTGAGKKKKGHRKCKKGRKGNKCRKKKNNHKHTKPPKEPHHGPLEPACRRACYVDGEKFRREVLG